MIEIKTNGATLDCAGNKIIGCGCIFGSGIYADVDNITVKNCEISNFLDGIYLRSSYNKIINNNLKR